MNAAQLRAATITCPAPTKVQARTPEGKLLDVSHVAHSIGILVLQLESPKPPAPPGAPRPAPLRPEPPARPQAVAIRNTLTPELREIVVHPKEGNEGRE